MRTATVASGPGLESTFEILREAPQDSRVGSETRDAGGEPFWACRAYDYINAQCDGKCGGVWFDPLDATPEKFVEQAYYSILSGAPETLIHCYDYMLGDNGGTTPYGESFAGAHECGKLLMARMDELRRLADFCDAATRKRAMMQANGVSLHYYELGDALYLARLNTRTFAVNDELGAIAAQTFEFPKRVNSVPLCLCVKTKCR